MVSVYLCVRTDKAYGAGIYFQAKVVQQLFWDLKCWHGGRQKKNKYFTWQVHCSSVSLWFPLIIEKHIYLKRVYVQKVSA